MKSQMLRPERRDADDRRGCEEDLRVDHDVEEDLVQNVDVEVVHDERCNVDLLLSKMSKTTQMSMLTKKLGVAKGCRGEDADLVVEGCVEEVVQKMVIVMSRCGGVMSLLVRRVAPGMVLALLPC